MALVAAGCGGGDGSNSGEPTNGAPTPKEPLSAAAARLAKAVPRADCKELIRLMLHSIERGRAKPDSSPTAGECRFMKNEARTSLRGFKVTKVREFGPAGFSEGSGAQAPRGYVVGVVWLLDSDGSWKAVYDATFRPQIGVAPTRGSFDANARALVSAVRARNCSEFWRLGHVASRFVNGSQYRKSVFCKSFPHFYKDPKAAFSQIKADTGAEPKELGRTRDFAFYGLDLKSGRYMVMVLAGPIGGINNKELRSHAVPAVLEFLTVRQPR